jgi:hypothetical protein
MKEDKIVVVNNEGVFKKKKFEVEVDDINSGDANSGDVLTANGSGGATFQAPVVPESPLFVDVPVVGDWSNAVNALNDLKAATGITGFAGYLPTFALWEGLTDPDDMAKLGNFDGGTWELSFASVPVPGTIVKLIGISLANGGF